MGAAVASPADNLVMDPAETVIMGSHPFNCGGRCSFQFHVKNGVMTRITSVGDIPRAGAAAIDESISPYKSRACLRGYAQIKRTYAPDRLKTPLKQTISRGNLKGFVNISWEEALDTVASWVQQMQARQQTLGLKYLPILDCGVCQIRNGTTWKTGSDLLQYLGTTINLTGTPSSENLNFAKYAMMGTSASSNSKIDIFNTKFLLIFGQDPTIKAVNDAFMLTKAKEAGIPIVTISSTLTDTAKGLSSGYAAFNLPGWIQTRPQTDGAVMSAMANVIYQKGLHNAAFIKQYCFGFYPADTVVSQSTMKNPVTGVAYAGQTFTTPTGMSFVEYLTGLMTTYGGYQGVLNWASNLSGVPAATIENLAIAYASTTPAMLWGGNSGGQKTNNGMQNCMLQMALPAMTGNTNKQGGGPGFDLGGGPGAVSVGAANFPVTTAVAKPQIKAGGLRFYDMVANGRDQRTFAQIRADVLASHGIDVGTNGFHVEMLFGAPGIGGNSLNASPSTSKNVMAMTHPNLKYYVIYEQFITPTAAFADIILPAASHHERPLYTSGYFNYCNNQVIAPMYQSKTDLEIDTELATRLGLTYGLVNGRTEAVEMQEKWANSTISSAYKAVYPNATLPTWNQFSSTGVAEFPLASNQAFVGMASVAAGKYSTETGKINFFSPFLFNRDQALGSAYQHPDGGYYRSTFPPKAMYAIPHEGYENILAGTVGAKGIQYTLQFTTNHPRNRAHTNYDNVPMLKDEFPTVVKMHPIDAAARGITSGDTVYVYNDWGCIKTAALVTIRHKPGFVDIQDGSWYRASTSETYDAWFDTNMDGIPEKHTVPVDVGGCPNTITHDYDDGPIDFVTPAVSNNHFNGNLCEVSTTKPQ